MKKYIGLIITFIICLMISLPVLKADSGFDFSYDGGSSSSDYGSSYGHDSGSGEGIDWDDILLFFGILGGIILVSVVYEYLDEKIAKIKKMKSIKIKGISKEKLDKYGIDKEKIEKYVYDTYVSIQKAWMNFDYETLKELCSNELYNTYKMQMETLSLKGQKNIMKGFKCVSSTITNVHRYSNSMSIEAYLTVELYDYIINKDGIVIRGYNNKKAEVTYRLLFYKSNDKVTKCPNCGAKLKIDSSGKCEYCKSKIVLNPSKFVLSSKENKGQKWL